MNGKNYLITSDMRIPMRKLEHEAHDWLVAGFTSPSATTGGCVLIGLLPLVNLTQV